MRYTSNYEYEKIHKDVIDSYYYDKHIGKNLVDDSKIITGQLQSSGSILTNGNYGNYITTDFISIKSGEKYCFSRWLNYGQDNYILSKDRLIYLLYDSNKNLISSSYFNTDGISSTSVIPDKNGYIRLSTYKYGDTFLMLEENRTEPSTFERYKIDNVKFTNYYVSTNKLQEDIKNLPINLEHLIDVLIKKGIISEEDLNN